MRIVAVAAVFLVSFAVRWATLPNTLRGDDHWSLWTAATFLKGDWPLRDFADVGDPLYWGMSALAQALTGYRLVGEVVLGTALLAFALAIAFHLAWRASGSLAVAAGLSALALLVVTERNLYSYPKIFIYPLGLWLCWRYIDRPTLLRSALLAFGVAVAFLYRHDHGAYVGAGAAAAILATHWPEGPRRIVVEGLRFGVALLLWLSPYLALVQAYEGILPYFRDRMQLASQIDASSRRLVWFSADAAAPAHWFRIDPPRPARVIVEWKREVTAADRIALETQYGLTGGLDPKTRPDIPPDRNKWEYSLTRVTRENIQAIVEDPRVYDTGLIDRNTYRPMEESWLTRVQRSMPLFRVSIAPSYWHAFNAGIALHYISLALPYILLLMLVADRFSPRARTVRRGHMDHAPEKMFAAATMMAIAHYALLRNVGYFADHAAAAAVLGACVLGHTFGAARAQQPAAARIVSGLATGIVLMVSVLATNTYASAFAVLLGTKDGVRGVWDDSAGRFRAFSTSPPIDAYAPPGTVGDRGLIRYVYECTRPDDRIWLLSTVFTLPYYAERRIVGHIYWESAWLTSPEHQRATIARVEKEEVPIIIGLDGERPLEHLESYPLVHQYVTGRYTTHFAIPEENVERGKIFWLLTDSRRTPTGSYELLAGAEDAPERFVLPCYR